MTIHSTKKLESIDFSLNKYIEDEGENNATIIQKPCASVAREK